MADRRTAKEIENDLIEARDALRAYFAGDGSKVKAYRIEIPDQVDVKAIRGRLGLSQSAFAASFGFSLASVQSWERTKNRHKPDRAARAYLMVISRQPVAVHKALQAA